MRHRLVIIVVFLLAGTVVNVAVAWGCAVFVDTQYEQAKERWGGDFHRDGFFQWSIAEHRTTGAMRVWSRWADEGAGGGGSGGDFDEPGRSLVPVWAPFVSPDHTPRTAENHNTVATARGWPWLSVAGGFSRASTWYRPVGAMSRVDMHGAIALDEELLDDPNRHDEVRLVPLRPLPVGFVSNTLFYAGLLWLLICGPSALRRYLRVRRGLCPKCAYPTGDSPTCSECGCELPTRARPAT